MAGNGKRGPGRPRKRPRRGTAGGQVVLARYGPEHYQQMSAKGNAVLAARRAVKPAEEKLVDAHLTLSAGLLSRLSAVAKALGLTRSALIRTAIDDYMTAYDQAAPRT